MSISQIMRPIAGFSTSYKIEVSASLRQNVGNRPPDPHPSRSMDAALAARVRKIAKAIAHKHRIRGEDAEDVAQETVIRAWKCPPPHDRFDAYVSSIAKNASVDFLRRSRRRPRIVGEPCENIGHALEPQYETVECETLVGSLCDELSTDDVAVIEMLMAGASHADIARRLGIGKTTVAQKIARLRHRMTSLL